MQLNAESKPLLGSSVSAGIKRITLQNPPANSLSLAMIAALQKELDEVRLDKDVKCVVIEGNSKVFSAGHDLKEMTAHRDDGDNGKAHFNDLFQSCTMMMLTIASVPVPVIAQVEGIATAAGCQLVATCDMAIAAETARFGVNGITSGLFCSTPQVALTRNVPRKIAFEMLVTGDLISANRAAQVGLVNQVVTVAELFEKTQALATKAAAQSRNVVELGKAAFYRQIEQTLTAAYEDMQRTIVGNLLMDDAKEGIGAFIQKRTPVWPE